MNSDHFDICWLLPSLDQVYQKQDLALITEIAKTRKGRYCVAWIGKAPATPPVLPQNVEILHAGEPRMRWDLARPAPPLDEDLSLIFLRILRQWQNQTGLKDETNLLRALAKVLQQAGNDARVNALWARPEMIRAFVETYEKRMIPGSCVESILIANDLLETLHKIVLMVNDLPSAKVFHSFRSELCGFIGALAGESKAARFIHTKRIQTEEDSIPFWLQTLPHHWNESLRDSRVFQVAGERALGLVNELMKQTAAATIEPFPIGKGSSRSRSIPPMVECRTKHERLASRLLRVGWLSDTVSQEHLANLGHVASAFSHGQAVSFTLLEATPENRRWHFDLEDWCQAACLPRGLVKGPTRYRDDTLAVDLLVVEGLSEAALAASLRALAAGVPCIMHREFRDRAFRGTPLEDAPSFTAKNPASDIVPAIHAIGVNRSLCDSLSQKAQKAIAKLFSPDQIVAEHIKLYEEQLA